LDVSLIEVIIVSFVAQSIDGRSHDFYQLFDKPIADCTEPMSNDYHQLYQLVTLFMHYLFGQIRSELYFGILVRSEIVDIKVDDGVLYLTLDYKGKQTC
jgi:hypothetical protein